MKIEKIVDNVKFDIAMNKALCVATSKGIAKKKYWENIESLTFRNKSSTIRYYINEYHLFYLE